ncbi:MAG: hypothetical protein K1X66_02330 [Verrucomicrobiae bacterium]|nr:hypothetical protein [Verrucomicrobiae bacterium]
MGGGGSYGGASTDTTTDSTQKGTNLQQYTNTGWLKDIIDPGGANSGPTKSVIEWAEPVMKYKDSNPGYAGAKKVAETLKPLDGSYENNTRALYNDRVERALATARTGSENVLAPLNRGKSFREADVLEQANREREKEIRDWRVTDSNVLGDFITRLVGDNAYKAGSLLNNYNMNMAGAAPGLAQALSPHKADTNNRNTGKGSQQSTAYSFGAGINLCCFIFLEIYNGKLPWFVRTCRDVFVTEKRRRGYIRMSDWLVPQMREKIWVKNLVNLFMVKPMTSWGAWAVGLNRYGWMFKPVCKFWFKIWDKMGE